MDITASLEISVVYLVSRSKLLKRNIITGSREAIGEGMILRVWDRFGWGGHSGSFAVRIDRVKRNGGCLGRWN